MLKVVTLVGTRPEIIKLCRVINRLDSVFEHVLVHTGQNHDFELNQVFFDELGIRPPDHFLGVAGGTAASAIAKSIERFDEVLETVRPDAMLLLGDTNSGLAVLAAKRQRIPIFHMEAGNRCFDQRVPEEINRKVIDHLSDINLVYTEHARRYLLAEGVRPDTIIKTGSPMPEVISCFRHGISRSKILEALDVAPLSYFVVSAHREENVDDEARLEALVRSLDVLKLQFGKAVIVSVHPRTRKRLKEFAIELPDDIHFMKPLGFFDYNKLQENAFCVISDSGTLTEESAILGFPAVMIRQAHERPEGMDEATVLMSEIDPENIAAAISLADLDRGNAKSRPVDYCAENVSIKVSSVILSYTSFVNRTVWHRN